MLLLERKRGQVALPGARRFEAAGPMNGMDK
jgi:hypothetical protein